MVPRSIGGSRCRHWCWALAVGDRPVAADQRAAILAKPDATLRQIHRQAGKFNHPPGLFAWQGNPYRTDGLQALRATETLLEANVAVLKNATRRRLNQLCRCIPATRRLAGGEPLCSKNAPVTAWNAGIYGRSGLPSSDGNQPHRR
jgi:hypothetical protein